MKGNEALSHLSQEEVVLVIVRLVFGVRVRRVVSDFVLPELIHPGTKEHMTFQK